MLRHLQANCIPAALVALGVAVGVAARAGTPTGPASNERTPATFVVVGYLPDYRLDAFDPGQAKYLTDLVVFSAEAEPEGGLNHKRLRPETIQKLQPVKEQHKVRLLLCVGGWGRSKGFARLAGSAQARDRFAQTLVAFCSDNHFDGVDLDWEHPANAAEQKDWGALLSTVRKAFAPRRLLLTVAIAGWQELPGEAVAAVDRFHLMAYDAKGRHSTPAFAEAEVERVIRRGVPAAKICLGLPFYGKGIDDPSRTLTYAELVQKYHPTADADEADGVYFNGPRTVERKTKFALGRKLGGVMAWEVGQDARDEHSLLRAIHSATRVAPER